MSAWETIEPRKAWTVRLAALGFWDEGRLITSAVDIADLATRARDGLMARDDIKAWDDSSRTDYYYSRMWYSYLAEVLRNMPDVGYKLFDWVVREFKKGVDTSDPYSNPTYKLYRNGMLARTIREAAIIFSELGKKNKPLPNYKAKAFDFDALEKFVYDNVDVLEAAGFETGPGYNPADDDNIVYRFPDGWTIRRLTGSRPDLEVEGEQMQNCIRLYNTYHWDQKIDEGYSGMYSLRDPRNYPHASMEFSGDHLKDDVAGPWLKCQEYGKQNATPIEKYQAYLDEWYSELLSTKGIEVAPGYHERNWRGQHDQGEDDPDDEEDWEDDHEPEHLEHMDDTIENPNGDIDISSLDDIMEFAIIAEDDPGQLRTDYDVEPSYTDDGDWYYEYLGPRYVYVEQDGDFFPQIAEGVIKGSITEERGEELVGYLLMAIAQDLSLRNWHSVLTAGILEAQDTIDDAQKELDTHAPRQEEQLFSDQAYVEWSSLEPRTWVPDEENWGAPREFAGGSMETLEAAKSILAWASQLINAGIDNMPTIKDGADALTILAWLHSVEPMPARLRERQLMAEEAQVVPQAPQAPFIPRIIGTMPHPAFNTATVGWTDTGGIWVRDPTDREMNGWEPMTPQLPGNWHDAIAEGMQQARNEMGQEERQLAPTTPHYRDHDEQQQRQRQASMRHTQRTAAIGFWHEGRLITAADIQDLAEKARLKIMSRPDIAAWSGSDDYTETRAHHQLMSLLDGAPAEAYKLYDWLAREFKKDWSGGDRNPVIVLKRSRVLNKLLREAAIIFSEYGKKNKPLPNYKAKDFDLDALEAFINANVDVLEAVGVETGPGYSPDDENNIVYTFPDGWTIRRLNGNQEDLYVEGEEMQNCIKDEDESYAHWADKIHEDYTALYSLRDPRNYPHASMEFCGDRLRDGDTGRWYRAQVYGKQNQPPIEKYQKYLDAWYKELETAHGLQVEFGDDRNDWMDDHEEEHEPERLDDSYNDHPEGDFPIYDLSDLEGFMRDADNRPWDFQEQRGDDPEEDDDGDYWYEITRGREVHLDSDDIQNIVRELTTDMLAGDKEAYEGYELARGLLIAASAARYDGWINNPDNVLTDAAQEARTEIAEAQQEVATYAAPQEEQLFEAEEYLTPWRHRQIHHPRQWLPEQEAWGDDRKWWEATNETIQAATSVADYIDDMASALRRIPNIHEPGYEYNYAERFLMQQFPDPVVQEAAENQVHQQQAEAERAFDPGQQDLSDWSIDQAMDAINDRHAIPGQIGEPQPAGGPNIIGTASHPSAEWPESIVGWTPQGHVYVQSTDRPEWRQMSDLTGAIGPAGWHAHMQRVMGDIPPVYLGRDPAREGKRMSFTMYAASVREMANDMHQRITQREDFQKLEQAYRDAIPSFQGIDSQEEKNHPYHLQGLLFAALQSRYPESYKLWPWAFTKLKKATMKDKAYPNNEAPFTRRDINHAADIIGQAGQVIQHMRAQNTLPRGFDVNGLSFQQLEEWLYEHADVQDEWKNKNVVFQFQDGWTMQKVTDRDDLAREGQEMGHCVGGYSGAVEDGECEIYSLRDKRNQPHATIELSPPKPAVREGNEGVYQDAMAQMVRQVSGKQNSQPIEEYRKKIAEWFNHLAVSKDTPTPVWGDDYYAYDRESGWYVQHLNDLMAWWEEYDPTVPVLPEGALLIKTTRAGRDAPFGLPHGIVTGKQVEHVDWHQVLNEAALSLLESYEPYRRHGNEPGRYDKDDIGQAIYYAAWLTNEPLEPLVEQLDEHIFEFEHQARDNWWEYIEQRIREEMEEKYGEADIDDDGEPDGPGVDFAARTLNGSEEDFEQAWDEIRDEVENLLLEEEMRHSYTLSQYVYDLAQTQPTHKKEKQPDQWHGPLEEGEKPPRTRYETVPSQEEMPRVLPGIPEAKRLREQGTQEAPPGAPQPMTGPSTPEEVKPPEEPREAAFRFASVAPTYLDADAGPDDLSRVDYARWVEAFRLPVTWDPPTSNEVGALTVRVLADGEVRVDGMERLAAMRAQGWKTIPCEQVRYEGGADSEYLLPYVPLPTIAAAAPARTSARSRRGRVLAAGPASGHAA